MRRRPGASVTTPTSHPPPEGRTHGLFGVEASSQTLRAGSYTRAEPGNISFDCYENVDTPNQFVIVEAFADSDAGASHVATDHAKAFFEFFPTVITETPKIVYQELPGDGWSEMAEVKPA